MAELRFSLPEWQQIQRQIYTCTAVWCINLIKICSSELLGIRTAQTAGEIFAFSKIPRPVVGPAQSSVQWALGPLSPGLNWPECEAFAFHADV